MPSRLYQVCVCVWTLMSFWLRDCRLRGAKVELFGAAGWQTGMLASRPADGFQSEPVALALTLGLAAATDVGAS